MLEVIHIHANCIVVGVDNSGASVTTMRIHSNRITRGRITCDCRVHCVRMVPKLWRLYCDDATHNFADNMLSPVND